MSGATPNAVATACTPANGEDKEFLADLADQLATSQVATEVAESSEQDQTQGNPSTNADLEPTNSNRPSPTVKQYLRLYNYCAEGAA